MNTEQLIKKLRESDLYAECPCDGEFKLSRSIIFDGTKPFPKQALENQEQLKEELKEREDDLKRRRKLATKKAQITTEAVNIGKTLEKVLPTMKDFKWLVPDCKFLGDPIDLIVFNGLSVNKVKSISFIEVKSGKAHLNSHQKSIRDAIEEQKLSYKVFK